MLQPLGRRLLAPGRSSLEWTTDIGFNPEAKDAEFVQQRRIVAIHIVLLPGKQWGVEGQTHRVSDAKEMLSCWKLTPDSRYPDAYHSCYVLAGLSSTQYHNYFTGVHGDARTVDSALQWASSAVSFGEESGKERLVDAEDQIEALHPIFVIPWAAVDQCSQFFVQKRGF